MKIERLRLVVEEAEAAEWVVRLLDGQADISGVRIGFERDAIVFEGRIRLPLAGEAPIRTVWTVESDSRGRGIVRLAQASVFGWSGGAGFLTGQIMKKIERLLAGRPGFEISGDSLILDPAPLLAGLPVAMELRVASVLAEPGRLILEAG